MVKPNTCRLSALNCCILANEDLGMQRIIALSLVGAVAAACGTAYADNAAPSDAPSIYVAPMIQYSLQDNNPQIKDNYGYQAGIGVNLPHSWALEGDFSRGNFDGACAGAAATASSAAPVAAAAEGRHPAPGRHLREGLGGPRAPG
ncbi:MAG: hypothetical protein ABSG30_17500 [Steroidobacteraceae bacterium]